MASLSIDGPALSVASHGRDYCIVGLDTTGDVNFESSSYRSRYHHSKKRYPKETKTLQYLKVLHCLKVYSPVRLHLNVLQVVKNDRFERKIGEKLSNLRQTARI